MQIAIDFINFAFDWRPRGNNLHVTGGHSGTIYMRLAASCMQTLHALAASCMQTLHALAASCMQTLHALAASCMQSRRFFASTLQEQLFELKNEDAIKKSENLRDTCP
jgi:hypothetical protein